MTPMPLDVRDLHVAHSRMMDRVRRIVKVLGLKPEGGLIIALLGAGECSATFLLNERWYSGSKESLCILIKKLVKLGFVQSKQGCKYDLRHRALTLTPKGMMLAEKIRGELSKVEGA